ncbi:major facilitator superfamily domain-containing protein [Zychaea mexicana]|uniref:major facilitator superfamily domain-containing protein n=1 Tax=Zychaea mexicana TaxID=64656 RepID=UPI0022FE7F2D|nr:major facilitator superfamily domain-containing protein [Zychaea mexicana]KAI9488892.1 major facilitator superfamily domain-containing protein [Zychaea mexicana]
MPFLSQFRAAIRRSSADDAAADSYVEEKKKDLDAESVVASNGNGESHPERPSEDVQRGVRDVEAVTLTWSKPMLIAVFLNIWLLYFVNAFQSSILYNLLPYVTSEFSAHSLLNVIYIVANAISAAVYIPLAKVLDLWGRAEGFLIMALFATLGLILMAACNNLPTFCAAYVFYSIGFGGMTFCVDVITADSSKLKNRGLAYAFTSSPYIITAFAGAKASEGFYYDISWRWGFGTFAIVFPVVAAPLYFILKYNLRKAEKQGVVKKEPSGRTFLQSVWHFIIEFDILGVIIFSAGLTVFLLPFNIADAAPYGWSTAYIIAMIVVGFVMLIIFIVFEKFVAPVPLINFKLISDRTVIGACLLNATYQISYYCWYNYFSSFLQVVNNLTLAEAGYVGNTFDVVSGVLLLIVGFLIRKTGRFKWLLYIAVPLYIFAQGLMIYFRRPNQSVGYLVMCQVFISIGGAIFIIVEQLAILAAVDHQHIAAALGVLYVVGTCANAIGATICGAIWSNVFEPALIMYLPESALSNLDMIYEDLETQLSYEVGSPERLGIQEAYGYAQTRMLAVGTGIMGLAIVWTIMIRNINLTKVAQVKGMVF